MHICPLSLTLISMGDFMGGNIFPFLVSSEKPSVSRFLLILLLIIIPHLFPSENHSRVTEYQTEL